MLIRRYNPMDEFNGYRKGFNLVNDMINSFHEATEGSNIVDFKPRVNTIEGENAYHIEVDLPGVKKEDIEVKVEDNLLTIHGERKMKEEVKKEDYYKMESSYGSFSRSFTLPENVDVENVHANSADGVLEVVVPKLEVLQTKAKKIEIK